MCDVNWLRNWLPPILWTLQIFYFSLLPRGSFPKIDEQHFHASYLQYIYHFAQFFFLSLLIYRAIVRSSVSAKIATRRSHVVKHALLAIAIIAFVDELIQVPVPTRKFTVRDLMADVVGGGFGLLIVQMGKRSKHINRIELDRTTAGQRRREQSNP
jgi:VanZ family protein